MYLRIRKFLLVLVASLSVLAARAETDYTSQLNSIISYINSSITELQTIQANIDSVCEYIDDLNTSMDNDLTLIHQQLPSIVYFNDMHSRVSEIKNFLASCLTDLDNINANIAQMSGDLINVYNETSNIDIYVGEIYSAVYEMSTKLDYLGNLAGNLSDIKDMVNTAINDGELNKEDTQQMILTVITQMTDTADSIKEALDIITEDDVEDQINSAIASLREELQRIYRLLHEWDLGFFKYLYDIGYPQYVLDFFRIRDAPDFSTGYLTYAEQIGTTSPYSFVMWLAQALTTHIQGLQVINDNLLFVARTVSSTNTQEFVEQFQEEGQQYVESVQSEFDKLSSITYTDGVSFDPSQMRHDQINSIFDRFKSNGQYSPVRDYQMNWSAITDGFTASDGNSMFTVFNFRYDLTAASSFIEYARAFFTVLWTLMFASVFLWICFLFRRFYNWLFQSIAGNIPGGSSIPSMPIPK